MHNPVVYNVYICMSVSVVFRREYLSHSEIARAKIWREKGKTVNSGMFACAEIWLDLLEQPTDTHLSPTGLSDCQAT